ncbi:MAG: hypothetical protein Q4D02_02195 [Clostridia bacterium]|nr:hypothetical protein [Clostridia bacterium]
MKNRENVFVDIDGTMNVFRKTDHYIIQKMFEKHKQVLICDKLLWKINELDLISNSMAIFKLRILIYSILSFTSYQRNLKRYEKLYLENTLEELDKNYLLHLSRLKELGYEIHLVTHNEFTRAFRHLFPIKVLKNKQDYVRTFHKDKKISYMIGNNYTDDLRTPIRLGIKTIYIGKSKIVREIIEGKAENFHDIENAVNFIITSSSKLKE